jgi:hypothetical protein
MPKKKTDSTSEETPSSRLSSQEQAKLRRLLKAEDAAAIVTVFTMLETLQATKEDFHDIFSPTVIGQLVNSWDIEVWNTVSTALKPHKSLWKAFCDRAVERYSKLSGRKQRSFIDKILTDRGPDLSELAEKCLNKYKVELPLILGLTWLSDATAVSISKRKGELLLNRLTDLSDAVAESLSKHTGGELGLSGLTNLSDSAAESLSKHKGDLSLSGLTSLSDAAAKSLSKHKGNLDLSGLTSLSDSPGHLALAQRLSNYVGWVILDGLTSLSDKVAEIFSQRKGNHLELNGLTDLSEKAAAELVKNEGDLSLDGLTQLSEKLAKALAKHEGMLCLNGLQSLSDEAAEALAEHEGYLVLDGIRYLSRKAIEALRNHHHRGDLSIGRLQSRFDKSTTQTGKTRKIGNRGPTKVKAQSLSDEEAHALLLRVGVLEIAHVTTISDSVAEILSKHRGGSLMLPSVTHLSDKAAEWLSLHKGPLHLTRLNSLSDKAAECLGKRSGMLRLDGLGSLTDGAAKGLCKHSGQLILKGLRTLSDQAAASLATHRGGINLFGLTSISDIGAEYLCVHRYTTKPAVGNVLIVNQGIAKKLQAARDRLRRNQKKA